MEKTIEYMRTAVLAECRRLLNGTVKGQVVPIFDAVSIQEGYVTSGLTDYETIFLRLNFNTVIHIWSKSTDREIGIAYCLLGLDKRDALEAERAFWTASTDSLTKSLEAEKVKNANGGEFKDMLQQVLNHSNRPEMDDAQFRMFARENINHLLYGNKEGKKDEN